MEFLRLFEERPELFKTTIYKDSSEVLCNLRLPKETFITNPKICRECNNDHDKFKTFESPIRYNSCIRDSVQRHITMIHKTFSPKFSMT